MTYICIQEIYRLKRHHDLTLQLAIETEHCILNADDSDEALEAMSINRPSDGCIRAAGNVWVICYGHVCIVCMVLIHCVN